MNYEDYLKQKYGESFKTSATFYIPGELLQEVKEFCKDNKISHGFFAYVALKQYLEAEKFRKRVEYCEPM